MFRPVCSVLTVLLPAWLTLFPAGLLAEMCPEGVSATQRSVAALLRRGKDEQDAATASASDGSRSGDAAAAGPAPQHEHVMTHWYASRALRRLLLSAALPDAPPSARACATTLWRDGLDGRVAQWAGSHGDKVLAAFVRCGVDGVADAASKQLGAALGESAAATERWADEKLRRKPDAAAKAAHRGKGAPRGKVVPRGKGAQPAAALKAVSDNRDGQAATAKPQKGSARKSVKHG